MSNLERRVEALEARLRESEDRLAIYHLLASYPLAVDSFSAEALCDVYTEDGTYDQHAGGGKDSPPIVGRRALMGVVHMGDQHANSKLGCAHIMHMPHIEIHGDSAVATGITQVFVREGEHWRSTRTSANRWDLVRTPNGWKAKYRLNRLLDGTQEHRDILGTPFNAGAARPN